MTSDKIIELSETASAVSDGRKKYEKPMVTVIVSDADDIIMMSGEPGETPFVPMLF